MKVTIATAQYPINFHQTLADWQKYTENWVKSAVEQKSELLLFPEYSSMELTSLFEDKIRQDLQKQVLEMDSLKEVFAKLMPI